MTFSSLDYAGLVGKHVRMERLPDEVEYLEAKADFGGELPANYMVGCEGLVAYVHDSNHRVGGKAVEVVMDYGMGYPIFEGEEWVFHIWPDDKTADLFRQGGAIRAVGGLRGEIAELRSRIEKASTILCNSTVHLSERKERALDALSEPDQRNQS